MPADCIPLDSQRRLPTLYLSCAEQLPSSSRGTPLLDRLLDAGETPQGIVFITLHADLVSPRLACTSAGPLTLCIQQMLGSQGLKYELYQQLSPQIEQLLEQLFQQPPATCIELQLCSGLAAHTYRQLGQTLQQLRSHGVLIVCLDRTRANPDRVDYHPPHDAYWRELIQQWVAEQQWQQAIKLADTGGSQNSSGQTLVSDASLCLMHAAFALGGLCQPQRFFGYGLDDQTRALAGFGWMR